MAVQVPVLRCTLVSELYTPVGVLVKKEKPQQVDLLISRNEFREIRLDVSVHGKVPKMKSLPLKYESLQLHRKFVKEGKLTISFSETNTKLLLSNAPPNELVIWVKALAAKLASAKDEPKISTRTKLLSEIGQSSEGISPVTFRDVSKMQHAEAGGNGLLRMRGYTPKAESPLLRKRKRDDKENNDQSPILSGNHRQKLDENGPTPKRSNLLARSTPNRKAGLQARRPLRAEPGPIMTSEQRYVLDAVKSGKNVFFTGGAGTGKSFLVQKIIGVLPPDQTFVTASTGVAAYQIGGSTLHSFAGIGSGAAPISQCEQLAKRQTVAKQWKKCKHLIIDEVSMVEGNYFKKLEAVARAVRGNDRPFGGIQLIMTGDFLQLPPVVKGDKERRFAFETSAWSKCNLLNINLTNVKRQSDQVLVDLLNRLRVGICSDEDSALLKATKNHQAKNGIVPTKLCTHTDDVMLINKRELEKCGGEEKRFIARDSDSSLANFLNNHTSVEQVIRLRVGAQVMLLKNMDVSKGLVNGARGRVESFSKQGNPVVSFLGGVTQEINSEKWIIKNGIGGTVTRNQIPLGLAWAFSIHKSQGMTLDCVEVSLARVFECGQAYVALSRARNLPSLRVLDFKAGCVRADPKVLKFYKQLVCSRPEFQPKLEEMPGISRISAIDLY